MRLNLSPEAAKALGRDPETNALTTWLLPTGIQEAVVAALVDLIVAGGVPRSRIVLFERSSRELQRAGFDIQRDECYGRGLADLCRYGSGRHRVSIRRWYRFINSCLVMTCAPLCWFYALLHWPGITSLFTSFCRLCAKSWRCC